MVYVLLALRTGIYRHGQAQKAPVGRGCQISRQQAHEDGKVVSPTHWPPLPPGNITATHFYWGTAVAQWLMCCATNRKVAGTIPAGVGGFFIDIKSFRSHYGPGVDSASNRNEYKEYFLGGKGGRCVRLTTLPPSCAVVTKSGKLDFMEPSGTVQACNGIALTYSCLLSQVFTYWYFS